MANIDFEESRELTPQEVMGVRRLLRARQPVARRDPVAYAMIILQAIANVVLILLLTCR